MSPLEFNMFYLQRRQWHPTPVLLPGKSHGQRSQVSCSSWGHEESDVTEWLHFHFSLSCIGEGNGNPFQCSYLENPRDGGAWWAAVYGVAQSRTWLKRLSSSSSSMFYLMVAHLWEETTGNAEVLGPDFELSRYTNFRISVDFCQPIFSIDDKGTLYYT